jgi:hypothetical protein
MKFARAEVVEREAVLHGTLVAVFGTAPGTSGWYKDPSSTQFACFDIDETNTWTLTAGPFPKEVAWDIVHKARRISHSHSHPHPHPHPHSPSIVVVTAATPPPPAVKAIPSLLFSNRFFFADTIFTCRIYIYIYIIDRDVDRCCLSIHIYIYILLSS